MSKTNAKQIGLRTESQNGSVKSKSQNATPRRLRGVHESASRRGPCLNCPSSRLRAGDHAGSAGSAGGRSPHAVSCKP